ncbi:tail fiber domain-containing protein, partial [Candidatus Microgenomates bacterium]|nr:tail fiber domain-containing protein [Candidatus Microgenomates bacterium]
LTANTAITANGGSLTLNNSGILPMASISGQTSFSTLIVDNTIGDLFTASSSGLTRFTIAQSGDVTIVGSGTTCTLGNGVGGTNCTSDIRLKTNIASLGSTLSKIMNLETVNFNWKTDPNGATHSGLIAQNVKEFFPDSVHNVGDYLGVDYASLVVPTIKALQEQQVEIDKIPAIQTELERINMEMASTSARLAKVEDKTASISATLTYEPFLNLDMATISGDLKVVGLTQLANTNIGGELQVGMLHFDDINASINSLTGVITIDSNLKVMGDATVSGKLSVQRGIELKDKTTGESYCVQIDNGEIIKTKGTCN